MRPLVKPRGRESGQSLTEYVMLLIIVAGMGKLLYSQMPAALLVLAQPFGNEFARVYEYGRPDACGQGYDNDPGAYTAVKNPSVDAPACGGSPANHPKYGTPNYLFGRGPQ